MKAILVIDMPVNCRECPCFYDYLHCQAKIGLNVLGDERPKGCPLKPMPSKKVPAFDPNSASYDEERERSIMNEIDGYNRCIEELLGEEV